jgi:hypothetical protein
MTGNTSVLNDYLDEENKVASRSTSRSIAEGLAEGSFEKREVPSNTSLAVTDSAAAQVNLTFKGMSLHYSVELWTDMEGSAVYIYGQSGPNGGQARVYLNNQEVAELNLTVRLHPVPADEQNKWETPSVLLYTTSGLDATKDHHFTIENLIIGKRLVVDYAIITQPQTRPTKS